jgi:hypothetical protein
MAVRVATVKPCRRCNAVRPINRPRGLCFTCYYTPGARAAYPSVSKFGVRGPATDNRPNRRRPLPAPVPFNPGTPAKVAELERRAERGERLFHPADGLKPEKPARKAEEVADPPVLYGLLTAGDAAELERRRLRRG